MLLAWNCSLHALLAKRPGNGAFGMLSFSRPWDAGRRVSEVVTLVGERRHKHTVRAYFAFLLQTCQGGDQETVPQPL